MNWRLALVLGVLFLAVGVLYWGLPYFLQPSKSDYQGAVLLIVLGIAMAFGFSVLLRGSRDL
jgi:hypothetical protein